MNCPKCGADVEVPTVDIGVGEQQCGPAFCTECDWGESYPEDLLKGDDTMKFEIIFLESGTKIASVTGRLDVPKTHFNDDDGRKVIETEQFLERLLGVRVHIQQVL